MFYKYKEHCVYVDVLCDYQNSFLYHYRGYRCHKISGHTDDTDWKHRLKADDIREKVRSVHTVQVNMNICLAWGAERLFLLHSTASDSGVPESPPASSPSPSPSCDLDPMDLHQLKREKLKMQIKVLRLQEEYYVRKLGGLLTWNGRRCNGTVLSFWEKPSLHHQRFRVYTLCFSFLTEAVE